MIDRETAKKEVEESCGKGWLTLVEILYDNIPTEVSITEIFQKYGKLEIRYEGESKHFEELARNLSYISEKICEICGKSGGYSIIDGWETTLCDFHFNTSKAKKKYRKQE
ncbi:hypothetical protein [Flagellimonas nanhaiensis]|uniref:Uncharacterized protein n=1 Tax=Flagellimonas nanhaiensis TaxID=2292706 RepID=A0A371JQY0_9FLAO|nr:hypothetical protein [Allomuricauda nanhaiensis]RDY59843.1 hypothetical protein DX873_10850 [Allomuricauda nanhaiensis]